METGAVDFQTMFNLAVGAIGVVGGWLLNAVWQEIKNLQTNEKQTAEKIASIETLVAGQYVKRDEFNNTMNKLFDKLDVIHDRISAKADRL